MLLELTCKLYYFLILCNMRNNIIVLQLLFHCVIFDIKFFLQTTTQYYLLLLKFNIILWIIKTIFYKNKNLKIFEDIPLFLKFRLIIQMLNFCFLVIIIEYTFYFLIFWCYLNTKPFYVVQLFFFQFHYKRTQCYTHEKILCYIPSSVFFL